MMTPITLESLDTCLKLEGFDVVLAQDGAQALRLWKKHRPDLLCLDIMMPHTSGYEVCKTVRQADPHVPILFFPRRTKRSMSSLAFNLGRTTSSGSRSANMNSLPVFAWRYGDLNRQLYRGGVSRCMISSSIRWNCEAERDAKEIELSPREIAILELLHEHSGQVVDRNLLLDRCWGIDYFPESRTLDQHIAKLRKRIELDPLNPQIIEDCPARWVIVIGPYMIRL